MTRLAYLESLSRKDKEYRHKYYTDSNILKATKEIEKISPPKLTRRYAIEGTTVDIDWASIAFNTYVALNPYIHPLARLRSGLKVAEELTFIDDKPRVVLDELEKLHII